MREVNIGGQSYMLDDNAADAVEGLQAGLSAVQQTAQAPARPRVADAAIFSAQLLDNARTAMLAEYRAKTDPSTAYGQHLQRLDNAWKAPVNG